MEEIREDIDYQNEVLYGDDTGQIGLLEITEKLLNANTKPSSIPEVVLKAITGAGKTIIAARYIREVFNQESRPKIAFIWLSIGTGGLQFQNGEKLTKLLSPYGIKVVCPKKENEFNESKFSDKTVVVLNWEKINNTKDEEFISNIMVGEKHNFKKAIEMSDVEFIVLIDEFHKNYKTKAYNLLMSVINPKFIIGMTATPKLEQMASKKYGYTIPVSKVRDSGMIKLGTIFNDGCENLKLEKDSTYGLHEEIIKIAIEKRIYLERLFANVSKENSNPVIPLCLIQIPNKDSECLSYVKNFFNSYKENGRNLVEKKDYVFWLSDEPVDKDIIQGMNSNSIRYLIFKQGVATGWDCPRAQVLVKFRRLKKQLEAFDIQTIGRVLRMPERIHYTEDDLNYAYIYALEKRFSFDKEVEDLLGNPETKNQKLRFLKDVHKLEKFLVSETYSSTYPSNKKIKNIILKKLEKQCAKPKEDLPFSEIHIFSTNLEHSDGFYEDESIDNVNISDNIIAVQYNAIEFNREFKKFIKNLERRFISKEGVKNILFEYFEDRIDKTLPNELQIIEKMKLSLLYKSEIEKAFLNASIAINQSVERESDKDVPFKFKISPKYMLSEVDNQYLKYLYTPHVACNYSPQEKLFINHLESCNNVKWWFKNGDKGRDSLCILYNEVEQSVKGKLLKIIAPTYPDFIVYFDFGDNKNGVGIYEIKDAHKVEDINDRKHVAIKDYINKIQTRSGSTIQAYGGIVKVIDYKAFDEEGNPIGEIENINVYPELKNE